MSQKITKASPWPERFWIQVHKTEGCWFWIGAYKNDYGVVMRNGERIFAHRASWEMVFGAILTSEKILHRCDNPRCVRPTHLFAGTQRDNILDCVAKGRWNNGDRNGEKHPLAMLTNADAGTIRGMYSGHRGEIVSIAKRYNVPRKVISRIVNNTSYRTPLRAKTEKKGESNVNTGDTASQVR